ncbi:SMP-30/gluconolactonase/LRE family protein [Aliikangiella coralliicola]|uniref:Uncharacterized protein n=1 Tax=Aliikangiella coralliicola TaxID=2592383 RepID=A0A545UFQ9_9GAMM|nr:hypothetical protein [Aliikangiella coralliicola]TQV88223.1 hypothetical protein FLL46_06765 [Aliikangiella coralliicola]
MTKLSLSLLLFLIYPSTTLSAGLELLWSVKNTFSMPESAAFDDKRQVIYISNVNEYAKDGNGFISRVSLDGQSIELKWLKGLNSPTGLAVLADTLYVADYDALVAINLTNGKIIQRFDAPDAKSKPVLNDVAISRDGIVYVSGSASQTIYRLLDNQLEFWVKAPELLKFANGLFISNGVLYHGGLHWNAFNIESGKPVVDILRPDKTLKKFDGITSDGNNGFLVTLIEDSRIWHIQKNGISQPLSKKELNGIDLQYLPDKKLLLVPQVEGGFSLFRFD